MSPRILPLLTIILYALAATTLWAQTPALSTLRDITVTVDGARATITLLVDRRVGTLVAEVRSGNAQLRARPMAASRTALRSARTRSGVRGIRARIERRDVLVLDVDLAREVTELHVMRRTADRIVVAATLGPSGGTGGSESAATTRGADATKGTALPRGTRRKWALSTIVIDAGHGGRDPGAIGIGGIEEKKVTLAVAKQLRRELERSMPGVKVVLTRSADSSVELFRRGQIANERDGRLFLSIHCNSQPDTTRDVDGFECYILRPGKSEEAARVVAEENGAIRFEQDQKKYDGMSAESAIVASMAQSAFARYSEQAAQAIRNAMRTGTKLRDRGVHQAGFFVLVGASMPAVLVEIGYLSSTRDVRILKTSAGQRSVAKAIARGIVRYEKTYSASLK